MGHVRQKQLTSSKSEPATPITKSRSVIASLWIAPRLDAIVALAAPLWQKLRAVAGPLEASDANRCRSSVVEHSIGNGEVDSSILSGSTIQINELGKGIAEIWAPTGHSAEMLRQVTLCPPRHGSSACRIAARRVAFRIGDISAALRASTPGRLRLWSKPMCPGPAGSSPCTL